MLALQGATSHPPGVTPQDTSPQPYQPAPAASPRRALLLAHAAAGKHQELNLAAAEVFGLEPGSFV